MASRSSRTTSTPTSRSRRSPRLATLDGFNRVIQVGGFSKTVTAALRVAYLVARPDWSEAIVDMKLATTLGNSAFAAAAMHHFLLEGGFRRHLDALRPRLAEAIARASRQLSARGATPWVEPQGGLFLWAELPGRPRRDGSRPVRARGQCGLCARPFVQLLAEMAKLHALQCRGQRRSARVRRARKGDGESGEIRVDRIATCAASATAVRAAAPVANWSREAWVPSPACGRRWREAPDEGGRRQAPW